MKLRIIWSDFAETQLDEIYSYYEKKASSNVARKLIIGIIKAADKLLSAPLIGQKENLLKHKEIEYRYFVFKNYKLIYTLDSENGFIKISDVFDTRQNPPKLERNT